MFRYTSACWRRRGFVAPLTRVRPAPPVQKPWMFARFESMEAGEDKSGHIKEGANTALFYFDSEPAIDRSDLKSNTNSRLPHATQLADSLPPPH